MDDEILQIMRKTSREHIHTIWQQAKNNDLDNLSAEDQQIANILLEHQDEFFHHFEFTDAVSDYDYDPEIEVNPFLHITIHAVIENQLEAKNPVEVYQFYNAMIKKKVSHHDAIHLIGTIFIPLLFHTLKYQRAFDEDLYSSLLKKYKNKKPDKIPAALEKDLGRIFPE